MLNSNTSYDKYIIYYRSACRIVILLLLFFVDIDRILDDCMMYENTKFTTSTPIKPTQKASKVMVNLKSIFNFESIDK